jgi:hypothetical protein
MPIQSVTLQPPPGHLVQRCGACGAEHRISLNRGAQKARTGPVPLQVGDTLVVAVDGGAPVTIRFAAGDFADFERVTAAQLAAKVGAALPGVDAMDDRGGLLIESQATGSESSVQIVGGTARVALGFAIDEPAHSGHVRPVLGVSVKAAHRDPNVVALRRCSDCGAIECLVRTFEAAVDELAGTHFQEHRRVVNSLAAHCKASGWSHPDLAEHHAAERAVPSAVVPAGQPLDLAGLVRAPAAGALP